MSAMATNEDWGHCSGCGVSGAGVGEDLREKGARCFRCRRQSVARALAAAYDATTKHDCPACGAPMTATDGVYCCEDCEEAVPVVVDGYETAPTVVVPYLRDADLPRPVPTPEATSWAGTQTQGERR